MFSKTKLSEGKHDKNEEKNVSIATSIYEFWVNNGHSIEVKLVSVGKHTMPQHLD